MVSVIFKIFSFRESNLQNYSFLIIYYNNENNIVLILCAAAGSDSGIFVFMT